MSGVMYNEYLCSNFLLTMHQGYMINMHELITLVEEGTTPNAMIDITTRVIFNR